MILPYKFSEDEILAREAYREARSLGYKRVSNLEKDILLHPYYIYAYSEFVIKGRWPEGEKALIKRLDDTAAIEHIAFYAMDVIKGRWIEAEEALLKSKWAEYYLNYYSINELFKISKINHVGEVLLRIKYDNDQLQIHLVDHITEIFRQK